MKKGKFNIRIGKPAKGKAKDLGLKEVSGYEIEIDGIRCFVHKDDYSWRVSDYSTGCIISPHTTHRSKTRKDVIEVTKETLEKFPKNALAKAIVHNIEKYGIANK